MKASLPRRRSADAELTELRARLDEAEQTLEAIRSGRVDALVVQTEGGERVFTLEGADHRYRRLVETMNEGAAMLDPSGTVLYCNGRFAAMLDAPLDTILGASLDRFVPPPAKRSIDAILKRGVGGTARTELQLMTAQGRLLPVFLSAAPNDDDGGGGVCLIATDLTEQRRSEEIVAAERLAASILDQAAEAIVVCDPSSRVLRASQSAHRLAIDNPLLQPFAACFPLERVDGGDARSLVSAALEGEGVSGVEVALNGGEKTASLLMSIAPLLAARGRIVGCVVSLVDISERKRAEVEHAALLARERQARGDAETANRMKDEFLATMSHELRTPLNAMLGWAATLRNKPDDAAAVERGLAIIERNARLQARLIEDVLDVSRIISGKLQLKFEAVETSSVVAAAIDVVRPAAEAKEIALDFAVDEKVSLVSGDPDRLQQIVWNLVSNAVKFTPRHGRIMIDVRIVHSNVRVRVSDSGSGIAANVLPHVFERFRQGDSSSTRSHGGLGLGLAIVRHLVELHGGTVTAESGGEGKGAEFTVTLPVRATLAPPPEAVTSAKGDRAVLARAASSPRLDGLRALVVDDDDDARELVREVLSQSGAIVITAASAKDAMDEIARVPPDVLVTDVGMPQTDGYALVRNVRALPADRGGRTPAVALTASAAAEDARRAIATGFQMHLPKPVEPSRLVVAVANLGGRTTD